MHTYLFPDPHFYHTLMTEGQFRAEDYNERIWESLHTINNHDPGSVLLCLGDIGWNKSKEITDNLKSLTRLYKILILGNHDKKSIQAYYNMGFNAVMNKMELHRFGYHIVFSHAPVPLYDAKAINIHGHFHNIPESNIMQYDLKRYSYLTEWHYLLALEDTGMAPVLLETFIKQIENKKILYTQKVLEQRSCVFSFIVWKKDEDKRGYFLYPTNSQNPNDRLYLGDTIKELEAAQRILNNPGMSMKEKIIMIYDKYLKGEK